MKLVKTKTEKKKTELVRDYIIKIEQSIVLIYLLCMLGIFPLHYKEQYSEIGNVKFELFWKSSLCFIGIVFVLFVIRITLQKIGQKSFYKTKEVQKNYFVRFLNNLSTLDYAVFIYAICVLLSYAFSDFKDYAFKGATGWEMGLCSQMIFIAVYFILSRQKDFSYLILGVHLISSALTFLFGILHRFEVDPLGMYEGLNLNQKIEFLSTIGQATWFSSYVCTVFAVGVALFYVSEKQWIRIVSGIYTVISFGILVTQNSDSAFMAIVGIMLLLGYYSLSDHQKWCKFWQIMSLMWGTFAGIGIFQRIFADRVIPLDTLSLFFSQSAVTWVMLLFSLGMLYFYTGISKREEAQTKKVMKIAKTIYKGLLILLIVGVAATIVFIYLNTKGYLLNWFGYQSANGYLLFDFHWGSNRGSTWMITWQAFLELPWFQKLFGVGPDSLSEYLYTIPEISELLHNLWGSVRLTNAHNEYLNSLLCYGIIGVISWIAVLIGGVSYFYNKAKENPFMIAFALCIMGYAFHNIFCYQQVCCTPFLFIVLGIGESLTKSEKFNTIK